MIDKYKIQTKGFFFAAIMMAATAAIQVPPLRFSGSFRELVTFIWISLCFYLFITNAAREKIILNKYFRLFLLYFIYFYIVAVILEIVTGGNYLESSFAKNINIAFFVFMLGYTLSFSISGKNVAKLFYLYSITIVLFLPHMYLNGYIGSGVIYGPKNSLGPALLMAAIVFMNYASECRRLFMFLNVLFGTILIVSVFLISNRASMVSSFVLMILFICLNVKKYKNKVLIILSLSSCAFLIKDDSRYWLFFEKITMLHLLNGGINSFSRGRIYQLENAWDIFLSNPLFGVGARYVENFQLSLIIQHGLIVSMPLFVIIVVFIFKFIKSGKYKETLLTKIVLYLIINGLVISFFEEQAPFGPGATYFTLWLGLGAVAALQRPASVSTY